MPTSVRDAVIASLAQLVGRGAEEISESSDLVEDLGVDSLLSVNLLIAVEDRVNSRVPKGTESSFVDIRTVGELVNRFETVFSADARFS